MVIQMPDSTWMSNVVMYTEKQRSMVGIKPCFEGQLDFAIPKKQKPQRSPELLQPATQLGTTAGPCWRRYSEGSDWVDRKSCCNCSGSMLPLRPQIKTSKSVFPALYHCVEEATQIGEHPSACPLVAGLIVADPTLDFHSNC